MADAPSQTRTVNKALALLGTVKRIGSITENTPTATTAAALWDGARDAVLVAHPWHFAKRRAALPAATTAPAFGFQQAFELPADCLRWLPPKDGGDEYFYGELEGRLILSDAMAPLYIRYIARIEDMLTWSAGFLDTMAARLAWEMAEAVTGGLEGVVDRMEKKYSEALAKAKLENALATGDQGGRIERQSSWNDARSGRGYRGRYA